MTATPADIRNAALLGAATVAAGFVLPVLPYLGLPLAAFALGWLTYRFGPAAAAGLSVSTALCVAVFGPALLGTAVLDGAFVAVALLAIGPVAAVALRRYPALNVAAGVAAVAAVAYLVVPLGGETLRASIVILRQFMTALASSSTTNNPAAVKAAVDAYIVQLSVTWPANAFLTMLLSSAIGVSLIGRAGRSLGTEVHRYGPLADMDVSFHVIWPTILGLGCSAAASLWTKAPAIVGTIGSNVVMMIRPFLFLQGAAVFSSLYRRMGAGRITKTVGVVLLLLTETFVPSVSVLGLVDLREPPEGATHGRQGAASVDLAALRDRSVVRASRPSRRGQSCGECGNRRSCDEPTVDCRERGLRGHPAVRVPVIE